MTYFLLGAAVPKTGAAAQSQPALLVLNERCLIPSKAIAVGVMAVYREGIPLETFAVFVDGNQVTASSAHQDRFRR